MSGKSNGGVCAHVPQPFAWRSHHFVARVPTKKSGQKIRSLIKSGCGTTRQGALDKVIQISGSMDNAVNFNLSSTDSVEDKVGFYY